MPEEKLPDFARGESTVRWIRGIINYLHRISAPGTLCSTLARRIEILAHELHDLFSGKWNRPFDMLRHGVEQ